MKRVDFITTQMDGYLIVHFLNPGYSGIKIERMIFSDGSYGTITHFERVDDNHFEIRMNYSNGKPVGAPFILQVDFDKTEWKFQFIKPTEFLKINQS